MIETKQFESKIFEELLVFTHINYSI